LRSLRGWRAVQGPESLDEGSAGEHGGESAPLGSELLGKLSGVLSQRNREFLLGIEDEELFLACGRGRAVRGHGSCGENWGGGGSETGLGADSSEAVSGNAICRWRVASGERWMERYAAFCSVHVEMDGQGVDIPPNRAFFTFYSLQILIIDVVDFFCNS
jgi:hypothetical protein